VNRPESDRARRALVRAVLTGLLSLGPGEGPAWRSEPHARVAAVLMVGEPTPSLAYRGYRRPV
jgi:hypothetical protein